MLLNDQMVSEKESFMEIVWEIFDIKKKKKMIKDKHDFGIFCTEHFNFYQML